jgi:hypothetical protein
MISDRMNSITKLLGFDLIDDSLSNELSLKKVSFTTNENKDLILSKIKDFFSFKDEF